MIKFGMNVINCGQKIKKNSIAIITIKNGTKVLAAFAIVTLAISDDIYKQSPTGGVTNPTPILITTSTQKTTGSIPTC